MVQVIDDSVGRTLAAASTLSADVKSSVEGNGANTVSTGSRVTYNVSKTEALGRMLWLMDISYTYTL